MQQPSSHELGLWKDEAWRMQPRDMHGRFKRVRHSPERRLVLGVAQRMRTELGLPADPRLQIRSEER